MVANYASSPRNEARWVGKLIIFMSIGRPCDNLKNIKPAD